MGYEGKHKKYPLELSVDYGSIYSRIPKGLNANLAIGTMPLYSRIIEGAVRVSKHKLLVELGEVTNVLLIDRDKNTSDTATIFIYGELDEQITNIKDIPWEHQKAAQNQQ